MRIWQIGIKHARLFFSGIISITMPVVKLGIEMYVHHGCFSLIGFETKGAIIQLVSWKTSFFGKDYGIDSMDTTLWRILQSGFSGRYHFIMQAGVRFQDFPFYNKRLSLVSSNTDLKIFSSTASNGRFRLAKTALAVSMASLSLCFLKPEVPPHTNEGMKFRW